MNTLRFSGFRALSTSFAHNASLGACGALPSYGPMEIGRCTMMNGIKLASARPFGAPMAACTILFQSGSRFESDGQLGATHFLRTCSTASGCAYSTFRFSYKCVISELQELKSRQKEVSTLHENYRLIKHFYKNRKNHSKTRVLQQLGSYITVTADRQSIAYTLRCPVPAFHDVKYYLLDIAARASFVQHELDAKKSQLKLDLKTVHPETLVMDLVQKACWGGGLNNSVFCEEERIDSMSADDMNGFTTLQMRSDTCSVGSYGLPFDELMLFAEMIDNNRSRHTEEPMIANIPMPCEEYALLNRKIDFNLDTPAQPRSCAPSFVRGGFEYHDLGPNSDTWIALAVPGCGNMDIPALMKHSIVAAACGTGSNTRGQHSEDRSPQPPLGCFANDVFTTFRAFNISYSDTGVFGILAKTRSCNAGSAACVAASFLKKLGELTVEQIKIGKERLKLDLSLHDEDCVSISEGMALQASTGARLDNAYSTGKMLDAISDQEVACTAKCLASKCCKMAVAVVGDVQAVPHDMEIIYMC